MNPPIAAILATALAAACACAFADESQVQLREGPGRELVQTRCAACHSLDYIQQNSPFPDRKLWEAEVNKMINAYGAPVAKEDVPGIVDYLARYYGRQ
jgi:mono/diheme cytochrome c family protein